MHTRRNFLALCLAAASAPLVKQLVPFSIAPHKFQIAFPDSAIWEFEGFVRYLAGSLVVSPIGPMRVTYEPSAETSADLPKTTIAVEGVSIARIIDITPPSFSDPFEGLKRRGEISFAVNYVPTR